MITNGNAGFLLDEAKRLVTEDRTQIHGDTILSFQAVAEMWQVYLRAANTRRIGICVTSADVAQMLSLLKKIRHAMGDTKNPENIIDDLGYVSIAGMCSGATITPKPTMTIPHPATTEYGLEEYKNAKSIR